MFRKVFGVLGPLLFMIGCTGTSPTVTPPSVVYEADLYGTVDGQPFTGVFVGSAGSSHSFSIQSKTDVNVMTIQSCHRFMHFEDVIQTGWFQPNRGFTTSYDDAPGIEDTGYCVVRLGAFTKQVVNGVPVGQAYAIGLFHSAKYALPGENICNGADGGTTGSSICQTMNGLIERLRFKGQVITARPKPDGSGLVPQMCAVHQVDSNTWEYTMPVGECVVEFGEVAAPQRKYIHLARGFSNIQYRGN